jgi:hypothetical protein
LVGLIKEQQLDQSAVQNLVTLARLKITQRAQRTLKRWRDSAQENG